MQALSSYKPDQHAAISVALQALEDPSLALTASSCFTREGTFAKFGWPDWPDSLKDQLAAQVSEFHGRYPQLRPVRGGSPEWQAVFRDWRTDPKSVSVIVGAFSKYFPGRVVWVRSERDNRGRISVLCMVRGLLQVSPTDPSSAVGRIVRESMSHRAETIPCSLQLSWKDFTALPPGPLSEADREAFNASIQEVFQWAASRIRPILDALHDRLNAVYGDRFRGLYVYGSYARPDAGIELSTDSDLDVAMILSDFESVHEERERFGDIVYDLSLENGLAISLVPVREAEYRNQTSSFTREISSYAVPAQ